MVLGMRDDRFRCSIVGFALSDNYLGSHVDVLFRRVNGQKRTYRLRISRVRRNLDPYERIQRDESSGWCAWYRLKQWQRLRAVSIDADDLEDTYEIGCARRKQVTAELTALGMCVEKVDVDVER